MNYGSSTLLILFKPVLEFQGRIISVSKYLQRKNH